MPTWPNYVLKFAQGCAHAEGYGPPENLPTRANNPGDLTGADAGSFQTDGTMNAEGVWKFVNLDDGWQALYVKLDRVFRGKSTIYHLADTIEDFGKKYSGGNPDWATHCAAFLQIPASTTLQQFKDQNG